MALARGRNARETTLRRWFVGMGSALALLGLVAAANLALAGAMLANIVGAAMFVGGSLQILHAVEMRPRDTVGFWAVSGGLYLAAAVALLLDPAFSVQILTLLLVIALGVSGGMRAVLATTWAGGGGAWLLISGLISIAAALLIAMAWPSDSVVVLGSLLAWDLLLQGAAMIGVGLTLKTGRDDVRRAATSWRR